MSPAPMWRADIDCAIGIDSHQYFFKEFNVSVDNHLSALIFEGSNQLVKYLRALE
jgi:hypothetical protein